jgi:hypothetical protein
MILSNLAAFVALTALVACGGGSSSSSSPSGTYSPSNSSVMIADASGNCTGVVVDAHNQVLFDAERVKSGQNREHLRGLKNSCQALSDLIGTNTCLAKNATTNDPETIAYDGKIKRLCDFVVSAQDIVVTE